MIVPEPDRNLLNGGFDEIEGIPTDQVWLTRHFENESEGWRFSIYYLKMRRLFLERGVKQFLDLYQEHTGSTCSRNSLMAWCRMIKNLECAVAEATSKKDLKAISSLKLGYAPKGNRK